MGIFDDAVPGGNVAKPLLVALGVLLAGKVLSGSHSTPASAPDEVPDQSAGNGGLLGGLGGLLDKMRQAGQGDAADSWVNPNSQNQQINPNDLGGVLGGGLLKQLSDRTGLSQDDLLKQLSQVLPGVVDKLTPNGQVPSNQDVARHLPNSPW